MAGHDGDVLVGHAGCREFARGDSKGGKVFSSTRTSVGFGSGFAAVRLMTSQSAVNLFM